jgi:hypothetical protein
MIPVTIRKYKREEGKVVKIVEKEREQNLIVKDLQELNERIKELPAEKDELSSVLIKEGIAIKEIVKTEMIAQVYDTQLAKMKWGNIFLFVGKNKEILAYLEKRVYELIEIKELVSGLEK